MSRRDPKADRQFDVDPIWKRPKPQPLERKKQKGPVAPDEHTVEVETRVIKCSAASHLGEIRATLMVNYGPEGRKVDGIIVEPKGTLHMLIEVLGRYRTKIEELEKRLEAQACPKT